VWDAWADPDRRTNPFSIRSERDGLPDHPQPEERVDRPGDYPDPVGPQEELVGVPVEAAAKDPMLRGLQESGRGYDHCKEREDQEDGPQGNLGGADEQQQHAAHQRHESTPGPATRKKL
jgi:hypothetical protein